MYASPIKVDQEAQLPTTAISKRSNESLGILYLKWSEPFATENIEWLLQKFSRLSYLTK